MIRFSIIIPHYDIPDLLVRCVQSIPVRDDIQVIVVDDQSPDFARFAEHCDALHRPGLEIYTTTKGGSAGRARNVGLDHARGEWLLFADADDYFVDDLGRILDDNASSTADVIFFRRLSVLSDAPHTPCADHGDWSDRYIDEYLRDGKQYNLRRKYFAPWGKMIRRRLVADHGFRFDETRYGNDYFFSACVGCTAAAIEARDYPIYVYTVRSGSLTDRLYDKPGEAAMRADICLRVQQFVQSRRLPVDTMHLCTYIRVLYEHDRPACSPYVRRAARSLGLSRLALLRGAFAGYPMRRRLTATLRTLTCLL